MFDSGMVPGDTALVTSILQQHSRRGAAFLVKREVKRHGGQPQPNGPGQEAVRGDQSLMSLLQSKTGQAPRRGVRPQSRYCTFAARGPGGPGWVLLHSWRQ